MFHESFQKQVSWNLIYDLYEINVKLVFHEVL